MRIAILTRYMTTICRKKLHLLIIVSCMIQTAFGVSAEDLNPVSTTTEQILQLNRGLKPETSQYFVAEHYLTIDDESYMLETPYGKNRGYAFKQQLGIALLDTVKSNSWHWGMSYLYARRGWSKEDFLIVGGYNSASQAHSSHMFGLTASLPDHHLLFNAGAFYKNIVQQSKDLPALYDSGWKSYGSAHWNGVWATCVFLTDLEQCHVGAELQARTFRNTGLYSYAPDITLSYIKNNPAPYSINIEQNIFNQDFYITTSLQNKKPWLQYGLLTWYPDKGRFFKIELSSLLDSKEELHFGGEVSILFIRMAYSHPKEFNNYMGETDRFVFEFRFELSSANGFFVPGAVGLSEATFKKVEKK